MKNEDKVVGAELELFKERAAFLAIFFVTLMVCGFFRMGDNSPLIAMVVMLISMYFYFKKYRKAKELAK